MSALKRLEARIYEQINGQGYFDYRGTDWWQLDENEEAVFRLSLDNMPILVELYKSYRGLKGGENDSVADDLLIRAIHNDFPHIKERPKSQLEFILFAERFRGASGASAFYSKVDFWNSRNSKTIECYPVDAEL